MQIRKTLVSNDYRISERSHFRRYVIGFFLRLFLLCRDCPHRNYDVTVDREVRSSDVKNPEKEAIEGGLFDDMFDV